MATAVMAEFISAIHDFKKSNVCQVVDARHKVGYDVGGYGDVMPKKVQCKRQIEASNPHFLRH